MKRQSILVLVIPVLLFLNESMGDVVIIYPSDDAAVDSNVPDDNFGSTTYLWIGHGIPDEGVGRSYLKFNLSSIPANKMVISARLRLDPGYVSIPAPQVGAHYLTSDAWGEMTITWNNAPTGFNSTATDTVTVNITESFWTVTEDVDDAYRGDGIYSVVMKLSDEASNTATSCSSSEAIVSEWWPYVEVEYGDQKYSGGNGSAENPYRISTAADMNEIGANPDDWAARFVMVNDVNLADYTGTQFNIIGYFNSSSDNDPFGGVFDGNGHTIYNFTYSATGFFNYLGLFGCVGENGLIRDLIMSCSDVAGGANGTGALVGLLHDGGQINNCGSVDGEISGTTEFSSFCVGGLIGELYQGSVSNSYVQGDSVSGNYYIGGLVGDNYSGTITNCYSTASVQCTAWKGGLVGYSESGTVSNSFWDVDRSGQPTSFGGIGKTTAQMKQKDTFANAGWDLVEIWNIGENQTYPYLRVYPAGDLNHDGRVDFFDFAIVASHWLEGTE
ncbi:hypothetical protein ES703_36154 [subsurface metagenome]